MVYRVNPHKMQKSYDYAGIAVVFLGMLGRRYKQDVFSGFVVSGVVSAAQKLAAPSAISEYMGYIYKYHEPEIQQGIDECIDPSYRDGINSWLSSNRDGSYFGPDEERSISDSYLFAALKTVSLEIASYYYRASDVPVHMGILAIGTAKFGCGVMARYMDDCQYESADGEKQNQFLNIVKDGFLQACTGTAIQLMRIAAMGYSEDSGKVIKLAMLPVRLGGLGILEMIANTAVRSAGLASSPATR